MTHNGNIRAIVEGLTCHNLPIAHWQRIARVNRIVTRGSPNPETGLQRERDRIVYGQDILREKTRAIIVLERQKPRKTTYIRGYST